MWAPSTFLMHGLRRLTGPHRWIMPEWVHTLTVDASHVARLGLTGIGIVVQERCSGRGRGPVVDQVSELHRDVPARASEVLAIRRALEIALERGYPRIKVRSDCTGLRRRLREHHRRQTSSTDPMCVRVLQLARCFTWIDFGYVARRRNQLAYRLARAAWATERELLKGSPGSDDFDLTDHSKRTPSDDEFDLLCGDLLDDDSEATEAPF
jgi:hypothetical protein